MNSKFYLLLVVFLFIFYKFNYAQGIITTIAGIGVQSDTGVGGPAVDAGLDGPYSVALDGLGNYYIADGYSNRICKVDASGILTTIAGTGTIGYNGDNIPAITAELYRPADVICDHSGNIYIVDAFNARIRKINATTGIITTIAGNGIQGYNGDNMQADSAELSNPHGVALDASGNLYITDWGNARIRKVNTAGIITTIAGTGVAGYNGDNGPADTAEVNEPYGIITDNSGNIYFSDAYTSVVRKINMAGIITTIAGDGGSGPDIGDNGPADSARLSGPTGLAIDENNNIYIADSYHHRVRKVYATTHIITTIAGNGGNGYNGDNIIATDAELSEPAGICIDATGNMYIADFGNNRIRYVTSTEGVRQGNAYSKNLSVYPNPSEGTFVLNITSAIQGEVKIIITNTLGDRVKELTATTGKPTTIQLNEPAGVYFLTATTQNNNKWSEKVILKK